MRTLTTILFLAVTACGAGPYGYAREYVPADGESPHLARHRTVTYEDVRRDPTGHRSTVVGWFGVVEAVHAGPEGSAQVLLNHRIHQPRHLCSEPGESSCRVTVSEKEGDVFVALLKLRDEDRLGEKKLWVGSLVRVYGSPTGELDEDGRPLIAVDWYRHWPVGTYVTTGAAVNMRR